MGTTYMIFCSTFEKLKREGEERGGVLHLHFTGGAFSFPPSL